MCMSMMGGRCGVGGCCGEAWSAATNSSSANDANGRITFIAASVTKGSRILNHRKPHDALAQRRRPSHVSTNLIRFTLLLIYPVRTQKLQVRDDVVDVVVC